jgi:hypothetical protein
MQDRGIGFQQEDADRRQQVQVVEAVDLGTGQHLGELGAAAERRQQLLLRQAGRQAGQQPGWLDQLHGQGAVPGIVSGLIREVVHGVMKPS